MNEAEAVHPQARRLVEKLATGPELVYLFWPTIMGFLRIVTHPAVLPRPLSPVDAMANVTQLLDRPHVRAVGEGEGFWDVYRRVAADGLRGDAVPDGQLAALMLQNDVGTIYTRDRDFRRFREIEVRDPFA